MKLFSWSSLFFLLSLSFLWGCGYWVWLQTNQSQQSQLYSQLSLQLERSEVLLEDWQRNYRLHLDYLRADLAGMTPANTDNVIYDPWQELDDKSSMRRGLMLCWAMRCSMKPVGLSASAIVWQVSCLLLPSLISAAIISS